MVEPELTKGLLYVKRMQDTLIHLVWKERANPASKIADDDLIVFDGDCTVRLITQLPDHRVFFVKWTQTGMRKFFWLQHTDKSKDSELIKSLDDALNRPQEVEKKMQASQASAGQGASSKGRGKDSGAIDLASLMGEGGGNSELLTQLMNSGALDANSMNSLLQ